ncbi:MAG TPA: copper chaperone PCu(A)C [Alphaproteobacteria bacterium]|nr:copper chaperone PCu(A)C [Alphaproteobacteria bacterium]USO05089.1 MAG: copper chaperone PCu(A)C [Rhodospirillales bacterium]HOO82274.1 copper chaperone PCu(A)C [Alphaproteobacteria bacterium]
MKTLLLTFGCVLLGLSANTVQADDLVLGVSAQNAYAYATSPVQQNGAVFVEFSNITEDDLKITSAKADVSERVELHTHLMDGDMMMMREVDGYDVPAGASVRLEPMGHHIMLMGLKAPLIVGGSFPVTVMDEHGAGLTFTVEVKAPGETMDKPKAHSEHNEEAVESVTDAAQMPETAP